MQHFDLDFICKDAYVNLLLRLQITLVFCLFCFAYFIFLVVCFCFGVTC